MSRRLLLAALAGLAGTVAVPASAAAASGFCSPTGDYCTSAVVRQGAVRLALTTFSFTGKVRVCVAPPGGGTPDCRRFTLQNGPAGTFGIDVRWSAHFPRRGPGTYRVSFAPDAAGGQKLGPSVSFRRKG